MSGLSGTYLRFATTSFSLIVALFYAAPAFACTDFRSGTHNDAFNPGAVPIRDDFRSFGLLREIDCDRFDLRVDASGFTDRARQSRLDSLLVRAQLELLSASRGGFQLGLGTWMTGDFFGEDAAELRAPLDGS